MDLKVKENLIKKL